MITVAVLIPTTGRAEQLACNVGDLLRQKPPAGVAMTVVLAVPEDDEATLAVAGTMHKDSGALLVMRPPNTTAVEGWNMAYGAIKADWYVLGADDLIWHYGWLYEALEIAAVEGAHVIGLGDGHTDLNHFGAHYMASRRFCEVHLEGNIAPPEYLSWWFDREVSERAKELGVYAPVWGEWVTHRHPMYGDAPMDETHRRAWHMHDIDRVTYRRRQRAWRRQLA